MVKLQLTLVRTVKYIVELYHAVVFNNTAGVCNQGDHVFFPRRSSETDISS